MKIQQSIDAPEQRVLKPDGSGNHKPVIIVSNRGPASFERMANGSLDVQRSSGGLVTALSGLARQVNCSWISCAQNHTEARIKEADIQLENGAHLKAGFIAPSPSAYDGYYNQIANPLLWFLQHSMWNVSLAPVIDQRTWKAWNEGYLAINRMFAEAVFALLKGSRLPPLVMFQDYHLYLAPRMLRDLQKRRRPTVLHFIHIPWPGPEYWGFLPPTMRQAILDGLCSVDLLGFQTREDGLNFIRTCESYLPSAGVKYRRGAVWYRNHNTYVRDFPISIDVTELKRKAESNEVERLRDEMLAYICECKIILRIDRIEPSKNIVRGFQAYEELLNRHPEHRRNIIFLALLVPSRLDVDEYNHYLDIVMSTAGRINAHYGDHEWEPIRLLIGENYSRAIAALQIYDILLINSIADGMNLVAKEGPIVNQKDGVLILSDKTGAQQQLEPGATIISPCDVYATAEAIHQGLTMNPETRKSQAGRLRWLIEQNDINAWLQGQLDTLAELRL